MLLRDCAGAGKRKDALRVLEELKRQRRSEYVPTAALVQAYMGIGDKEQALAWLEQSYEEQSNILLWLKTESTFDPLRGDPRFIEARPSGRARLTRSPSWFCSSLGDRLVAALEHWEDSAIRKLARNGLGLWET